MENKLYISSYIKDKDKKYLGLDDILVHIAIKLICYRIDNNLSQKELAKKLGISEDIVTKLESGDYYDVSLKMLYEIAQALDFKLKIYLEEKIMLNESTKYKE